MADLFEIVTRELFMLLLLAALGSGPVSYLGREVEGFVKVTLAPALGLAVGAGVFTSLGWFEPATRTYLLVVVLALISLTVAWLRFRGRAESSSAESLRSRVGRCVAQFTVLAIVVSGPTTIALASHNSVGPTSYQVADVAGYVASTDAMIHSDLKSQAATYWAHVGHWSNLVNNRADFYAAGIQELDVTTFAANVDELLEYGATATWDPFLLAFVLSIALSLVGGIRYVTRRSAWIAVAGGSLVGGAFVMQLFFDTSEGSICGLAMVIPLLIAGDRALRTRAIAPAAVLGIVVSGIIGLYPLFMPELIGLAGALAAFVALKYLRHDRPGWLAVERAPLRIIVFVVLALGLNVDASWRTYQYIKALIQHPFPSSGLPQYALNGIVVPSWLFQLRGLYQLSGPVNVGWVLLVVILPVFFVLAVIFGARRYALALAAVPMILTSFASAGYERFANSCSYCEDRSLLPSVLLLIFLAALGAVAISEITGGRLRQLLTGAFFAGVAGVVYVGEQEYSLMSGSAYYFTDAVRAAIAVIPPGRASIELEGFNEGPIAYAEDALVYEAVSEGHWGQLSVPDDYDQGGALDYFQPAVPLPGPAFHANYGYVLTRLSDVFNMRTTLETGGGVALQQRVHPLDVMLDYGVTAPMIYNDPSGAAYLWQWSVPMEFLVTGSKRPTAFVGVRLQLAGPTTVIAGPGVVGTKTQGDVLTTCLRATGREPALVAQLHLSGTLPPRLMAMRASTSSCPYPVP